MTSLKIAIAAAAALFTVGTTGAIAQTAATPAPATKAPAATTPPAMTPAAPTATAPAAATNKGAKKPQTAESKACSDQADAQKLHGKPRKDFRKKCMKDAKAAAAKKPS